MKILLTGSTGFIGRHILRSPHAEGCTIVGVTRAARARCPDEIALGPQTWSVAALRQAFEECTPDVVVHAAGATQATDKEALFRTNTALASNLLEAAEAHGGGLRVLMVGSAAEYGFVPDADQPVEEDRDCRPDSAYGVSKYAQTLLALAARRRNLDVLVARVFNVLGPGMPDHLALPSFARRIASAPDPGEIRVGRLDLDRDFLGIDEAARILIGLARMPRWPWPIVNVCSGRSVSLGDVLNHLIAASGRRVAVRPDPDLFREGEMNTFRGSISRLMEVGLTPAASDFEAISKEVWREASTQAGSSTDSNSVR